MQENDSTCIGKRFSIDRSIELLRERLENEKNPIKKAKLAKRIDKHLANKRIYEDALSRLKLNPDDRVLKAQIIQYENILFPPKKRITKEELKSQSVKTVSGGLPSLGRRR